MKTFLPVGKFPSEMLGKMFMKLEGHPRLIIGPRVGEDAAVIDLGDRYLVAKSDPVTFVEGRIGWYAVHVNANDIACMGAQPFWFLVTLLLPENRADENRTDENENRANENCADDSRREENEVKNGEMKKFRCGEDHMIRDLLVVKL